MSDIKKTISDILQIGAFILMCIGFIWFCERLINGKVDDVYSAGFGGYILWYCALGAWVGSAVVNPYGK